VWPEAVTWKPPFRSAQRQWLLQYYSADEIAFWEDTESSGGQYWGWSVGISAKGDWEWFEGGFGD
jgi:hypothetical protein